MGNTYKHNKKEFDNDNTTKPRKQKGMKIINEYIEEDLYEMFDDEVMIHDSIIIEKQ